MERHMQQTLPANLQYYQKSGGYVPPHVQQQMAQYMQKSMPTHLQQYINPYMQQKVVPQHLTSMPGGQATHFTPHTVPTNVPGQQPLHPFETHPEIPPQLQPALPQAQNTQPAPTAPPAPTTPPLQPYGFITDPDVSAKSSFSLLTLLNGKSLLTRIAVLGGGLVVLLIVFSILKGLIAGSFNLQPFLVVLQDQQELIHLSSVQAQSGQAALPATYQNFLATTQLTVGSSQAQLLTYLTKNNQKIKSNQFGYSTALDKQLTSAETSDTYLSTFQQIMSSQLNNYKTGLRQAYNETSGAKGRAQLSSDYRQAVLLIKQFNQANSSPGS